MNTNSDIIVTSVLPSNLVYRSATHAYRYGMNASPCPPQLYDHQCATVIITTTRRISTRISNPSHKCPGQIAELQSEVTSLDYGVRALPINYAMKIAAMAARPAKAPYEADRELAAPVKLAIGGEVVLVRWFSRSEEQDVGKDSRGVAAWIGDTSAATNGGFAGDHGPDRSWVWCNSCSRDRVFRSVLVLICG
jgi:hypothetical protein